MATDRRKADPSPCQKRRDSLRLRSGQAGWQIRDESRTSPWFLFPSYRVRPHLIHSLSTVAV